MSWKLGKSKKATLSADRDDAASTRSITPTPGDDKPHFRTGILSIRVLWAEGLSVPQGSSVPAVVQAALSSQQAKVAASISPASVSQSRLVVRGKRDSIQRTQCWWLPYIVMEFEVNQILITPLGGELDKPLYMYQAHLYVYNGFRLRTLIGYLVMYLAIPRYPYNHTCERRSQNEARTTTWAMTFSSAVSSSPQTSITCPPAISGMTSTAAGAKSLLVFPSSRAACVVPSVLSPLQ
jgi:hypothetical protein